MQIPCYSDLTTASIKADFLGRALDQLDVMSPDDFRVKRRIETVLEQVAYFTDLGERIRKELADA